MKALEQTKKRRSNGSIIPNDCNNYRFGENVKMNLDKDGGIAIHLVAKKPKDLPEENWLPVRRKNEEVGPIMRIYFPDMEKMKTWQPPKAEKL